MPATQHSRTRLAATLLVAAGVLACGDGGAARGGDSTAAKGAAAVAAGAAAAASTEREPFESARGKFAIDFPGTWHGGYRAIEHPDTLAGSRFAVDFIFKPDPAWKVQPEPLLVVRIFPRAAWDLVALRPGPPIAKKVAERGDDIFAYSIPGSNPYKPGTPAAVRFDELVLAVVPELRVTPR
ncbi:MAG TPA: hypothetical protein VHE78_09275 [Gemmatimonadaceae bacterium]|nr:hypothetical protein [Gemmatimonadaceae bacterium]